MQLRKLPGAVTRAEFTYEFVLKTVKGKEIRGQLHADKAPLTVSNFIYLARNGFYDGLPFHRVEAGFLAQSGAPPGSAGPGWVIEDEKNDLKHEPGSLSMAKTGLPAAAGSQFFFSMSKQANFDGQYTVFGQVTEGLEQLRLIEAGEVINSIEVYETPR